MHNTDKIVGEDNKEHCIWNKAKQNIYYGKTRFYGKNRSAHATSYIVFNNLEDIESDIVRHRCKYKACVNLLCLIEGTYADNAQDRIIDGTSGRGEEHPNVKITQELVLKIKNSKGEGSQYDRSLLYGTSKSTVSCIDNKLSWA